MENDNKDREDLREIRRQLEEGDRETYVRRRPKAEPGVRIHGVYIPYLILRRALLGVLAVILILGDIWIYRMRSSESFHKAIAFRKLEPVIKICIILPAALLYPEAASEVPPTGESDLPLQPNLPPDRLLL